MKLNKSQFKSDYNEIQDTILKNVTETMSHCEKWREFCLFIFKRYLYSPLYNSV